MKKNPPYTIYPLGDSALTVDFGNFIDLDLNRYIHAVFSELKKTPLPGVLDIVPAYSSLTVFYSLFEIKKTQQENIPVFEFMKNKIDAFLKKNNPDPGNKDTLVRIPVCYEVGFGIDLHLISRQKNISVPEIIKIHTGKTYRVYMLGFQPGFAYMGTVDASIAIDRKPFPEKVSQGSVAIAGDQTGIYPFDSPGGWHILGRTPVKMFNKEKKNPVLLMPGNTIQFYPISKDEFENY